MNIWWFHTIPLKWHCRFHLGSCCNFAMCDISAQCLFFTRKRAYPSHPRKWHTGVPYGSFVQFCCCSWRWRRRRRRRRRWWWWWWRPLSLYHSVTECYCLCLNLYCFQWPYQTVFRWVGAISCFWTPAVFHSSNCEVADGLGILCWELWQHKTSCQE